MPAELFRCPIIAAEPEGAPAYHGECSDPGYTLEQMQKHLVDDNAWTKAQFEAWMLTLPKSFRCEHCGGVFMAGWSDEEAAAEAQKQWGELAEKDRAQICDDCYNAFMDWYRREGHAISN